MEQLSNNLLFILGNTIKTEYDTPIDNTMDNPYNTTQPVIQHVESRSVSTTKPLGKIVFIRNWFHYENTSSRSNSHFFINKRS